MTSAWPFLTVDGNGDIIETIPTLAELLTASSVPTLPVSSNADVFEFSVSVDRTTTNGSWTDSTSVALQFFIDCTWFKIWQVDYD